MGDEFMGLGLIIIFIQCVICWRFYYVAYIIIIPWLPFPGRQFATQDYDVLIYGPNQKLCPLIL